MLHTALTPPPRVADMYLVDELVFVFLRFSLEKLIFSPTKLIKAVSEKAQLTLVSR